jgi:hypothetical protein
VGLLIALAFNGCGINKSRLATEQLVVSDAVDRAVASIDFSPLSGRKVFFDTKYVENVTLGPGGSMPYVISSLRQQMLAYDCRLQEKADTADYIIEARVGVLQHDGHEVTYGIPGSAALGTASLLMSSPVALPSLPELSLGRRNHQSGTAKIGLFAYDQKTREPVWQAGTTKGSSQARDMWLLGLGPYQQRPTTEKRKGLLHMWQKKQPPAAAAPLAAYNSSIVFERAVKTGPVEGGTPAKPEVATVSHEQAAQPATDAQPATPPKPAEPAKIVPAPSAQPVPKPK